MRKLPVLLLPLLLVAGCRTVSRTPDRPGPARTGGIFLLPSGEETDLAGLARRIRGDRVVYLGESHPNIHHHRFQLRMVRAMFEQDPRLQIGMEMFQRPYQPALDRFLAGRTSEEQFLRETEYFTRWRWDWRYYRDIVLFARDHGIRVVALNAPAEVNRKVAREGLASLTPDERKWIAAEVDLGIEAHRAYVKQVFESHPLPPFLTFENFYASQCVWEDTMAESVAKALADRPGSRMAVIVGSGHVRRGFGIPIRAARRGARPYAVIVGLDVAPGGEEPLEALAKADLGDAVVLAPASRAPLSPRLGITVDTKEGKGAVVVKEITDGSIAQLAGVKPGDRIVKVGGRPTPDLPGLRIALALLPGRLETIEVERGGRTLRLPFDTAWLEP